MNLGLLNFAFAGAVSDDFEPSGKTVQSACASALTANPIIKDPENLRASLVEFVREVGRGEHAVAYLHRRGDGSSVVQRMAQSGAEDQLKNDYDAFKYLEGQAEAFPFAIVRVLEMGTNDMLMEFAEGTNLETLMSSPDVSEQLKEKLRKSYMERLSKALRFFDERCFEVQYRSQRDGFGVKLLQLHHQLRATCEKNDRYLEFIIKSDNIIVNLETLDMWLVDPY